MITKDQYIAALTNEFRIIKHLAKKVTLEQLDHKPTETQRTTKELMHYLTYIFQAGADSVATGNADAWKNYTATPEATLENFASLMDEQESKVRAFIEPLSEKSLTEEIAMWGRTQARALHLLGLLNIASAYKMQLFLYLKQSGTANIGTMNLWAGMDQPPQAK